MTENKFGFKSYVLNGDCRVVEIFIPKKWTREEIWSSEMSECDWAELEAI